MDGSPLITNTRRVNEGLDEQGALLVRDGQIARVGGAISTPDAYVIGAAGRAPLPGDDRRLAAFA